MRKNILILLLLPLVLMAQDKKIVTISFEYDTGYELQETLISEANALYNDYNIYFEEVPDTIPSDVSVRLIDASSFIGEYEDGEKYECVGDYGGGSLRMAYRYEGYIVIFCHELGHHLGLGHVDGDYLMNPRPSSMNICNKNKCILYNYNKINFEDVDADAEKNYIFEFKRRTKTVGINQYKIKWDKESLNEK